MIEVWHESLPRQSISSLAPGDRQKVLVMGGGGIAPGVVTATLSIVQWLLYKGMRPIGLVWSWEWVQTEGEQGVIDFAQIPISILNDMIARWGTCLWPGRGMLLRDGFRKMRTLQEKIGFIGTAVVWGDGTISGSQALQYSLGEDRRPVADTVACIKTIDADAEGSLAIGFETSASKYAENIVAMKREIEWESWVGIVWVYGRDNGHLALHASTLAESEEPMPPIVTLIPEFSISREHFLDIVQQRKEQYWYVCIVVSEGFAFEDEEQNIDSKRRDGAGNPVLLGCVNIIREIIERDTKLNTPGKIKIRTLEPGISTRSCDPIDSDIQLAKTVWEAVSQVIEKWAWGHVVNMQWDFASGFGPVVRPLWEVHTGNPVIAYHYVAKNLWPTQRYRDHIAQKNPVFHRLKDMSLLDHQKQVHEMLIAQIAAGKLGELVEHNGVLVPQWAIQDETSGREKPTLWYGPISSMYRAEQGS